MDSNEALRFDKNHMKIVLCKECKGHGFVNMKRNGQEISVVCPVCNGMGRVVRSSIVSLLPMTKFPELMPPKDSPLSLDDEIA